jgi:hypothetical protein
MLKINEDVLDTIREDCFLEDVFGFNSRLEYAIWLERTVKFGAWILNAHTLRAKVLEKSELNFRY